MTRPRTQEFLVIEGGVPLTGTIRPEGNKNAALALLPAALLTAVIEATEGRSGSQGTLDA